MSRWAVIVAVAAALVALAWLALDAWVDDRYCKLPVCDLWRLHQREARAARRGLWADPDPVPPWTWRKMQRTKHKK